MFPFRSLLVLFGITAIIIAAIVGLIFQLQKTSVQKQIATTFQVSAREIAGQLSLPVKVHNIQEINRILSRSYLYDHTQRLTLVDQEGQAIVTYPPDLDETSVEVCGEKFGSMPVIFSGAQVGVLKFCYDEILSSADLFSGSLLFFIVALLCFMFITIWWWHRLDLKINEKFFRALDRIDIESRLGLSHDAFSEFQGTSLARHADKTRVLLTRIQDSADERRVMEAQRVQLQVSQQVSHDIKSPLLSLKVLKDTLTGVSSEQRGLLTSAVKRIQDIVNDLDLTRATLNSISKSAGIVDVAEAIERVFAEKKLQYPLITWEWIGASSSSGYAQEIGLQRVFSNLFQNAVEAFGDSSEKKISLIVEDLPEFLKITVKDSGCGIPPDIQEKVFDRGFSFQKAQGSGLGLSQARSMVRQWGGDLVLRSELGKGTEIEAVFHKLRPFLMEEVDQDAQIIVVEDCPAMGQAWKTQLKKRNFQLFNSSENFEQWMSTDYVGSNQFFIFDFDLGEGQKTGLDLIRQYNLRDQACIVSGQAEQVMQIVADEDLDIDVFSKSVLNSTSFE